MQAINPDALAQQGQSVYDNLSDEELNKLLNDSIKVKRGHQGRFQTPLPPKRENFIDYDAKFGLK